MAATATLVAAVACGHHAPSAAPPTTPPPAQASLATTSVPPTTVGLQPGPHSAIADVDLPEGTVQCTTNGCPPDPHREHWQYSAPYDDVVAFLRTRFATGRRFDTHGATWWNGLPPCYDKEHQSPPWGRTLNGGIEWAWSDGAKMLAVDLNKILSNIEILEIFDRDVMGDCYRA